MIKRQWTKSEVNFMKEHYGSMTINSIAVALDRTAGSVHRKAKSLGLVNTKRFYTDEQIKYLKANYFPGNAKHIANKIGKTVNSVRIMATKLHLGETKKKWSDADLEYLKNNYADKSVSLKTMSDYLDVSEVSLRTKAQRLGLTRKTVVNEKVCIHCGKKIYKYGDNTQCYNCMLKNRKGENHPRWQGGISTLTDMIRRELWEVWGKKIMERDGYKCQICDTNKTVHVHHLRTLKSIRKRVLGLYPTLSLSDDKEIITYLVVGSHKLNEGVTVCKKCHIMLHYSDNGVNCWKALRAKVATTQLATANVKAKKDFGLGDQQLSRTGNCPESSTTNVRFLTDYAEESNDDTSALNIEDDNLMLRYSLGLHESARSAV